MIRPLFRLAVAALLATPAAAQSVGAMQRDCAETARAFFRDFEARADLRYDGRRTDGTHAIGGTLYLETRGAYVSCSYGPGMRRMTEFYIDGRDESRFLAGGHGGRPGGGPREPRFFRVTGVPRGDVLNLRAGPGPRQPIVGALGNGDQVRNLGCEEGRRGTWCRVGLLDEMGGEGWANARYLTAAGARPPARPPVVTPRPPAAGPGGTKTVRLSFPPGTTGTEFTATLQPGASTRYLLGARARQTLYVRVVPREPRLDYQIFNPDGTFLLGMVPARQEYRGQLWQSGDHAIEVINRTNRRIVYNLIVGIN